MSKLNIKADKLNKYIEECKKQIIITEKINDKYSLENVKNYKEMLKILESSNEKELER